MIHKLLVLILNIFSISSVTINYATCQTINNYGNDPASFPIIEKDLTLTFPDDHGAHDEYRIEWWYLTANLTDQSGNSLGLQWTLFRAAMEPENDKSNWNSPQIWMGHAALTGKNFHFFEEKLARGGVSQAGVSTEPFEAWIDDWYLAGDNWKNLTASAGGQHFKYSIELKAQGPIIKHGNEGRSIKSASGQASAYYSQPFFQAEGWIEKNNERIYVTGSAWADHEWSSQFVSDTQLGWDWFSLSLDSGEKVMAFRVREKDENHFYSGTWIGSDGNYQELSPSSIYMEPLESKNNNDYYTDWIVRIESFDLNIKVKALNPNAKMKTTYPYWEGPITFNGSHTGLGYLEMTGYAD